MNGGVVMSQYLKGAVATKETPQTEPIPGSNQVANSAGGYSFAVDMWTSLDRFLILGSEGGSYYASEKTLTKTNAKNVMKCIKADGVRVVNRVVEISDTGRAPKNDPAVFVLAMCAGIGDDNAKKAALEALPKVCRIGTHLFHFAAYVQTFRGWGRGLKKAISNWYDKPLDKLAYQLVKYQSRDDWSHRDLLRLIHKKPANKAYELLFKWVVNGWEEMPAEVPSELNIVKGFEIAKKETDSKKIAKLILDYRLPREAVPTSALKSAEVWEALLKDMPLTATIRNLGNMSKCGLLSPMSVAAKTVCERITNAEELKKARVHPIQILSAMLTYSQGHGMRGHGEWTVVQPVVDALDTAFYASFGHVVPTGKRILFGLDVSGSMDGGVIAGVPGLTPRMGAAALAMTTARVESQYMVFGFTDRFVDLKISPRQRLNDVVEAVDRSDFGTTDCAVPMTYALDKKIPIDAFVVLTDSETYMGNLHPSQALTKYRNKMGIPAKLIVVGMVGNDFSIADPKDAGMLDVVGFDTSTPQLMSDFIGNKF